MLNPESKFDKTPMLCELVSYADAKAQGRKKYFTGVACVNGHLGPRYVSNKLCVKCAKSATTASFLKNKEANFKRLMENREKLISERAGFVASGMKRCSSCKLEMDVSLFSKDKYQTSGLKPDCRKCQAAAYVKWSQTPLYDKRLRKVRASRMALKAVDPKLGWAKRAKNAATARAKAKGEVSEITTAWLYANAPDICPLLEIPLSYNNTRSAEDSAALDRIDNTKGYTLGNCWVVSMRANRIKTDATPAEIALLAKNLLRTVKREKTQPALAHDI